MAAGSDVTSFSLDGTGPVCGMVVALGSALESSTVEGAVVELWVVDAGLVLCEPSGGSVDVDVTPVLLTAGAGCCCAGLDEQAPPTSRLSPAEANTLK